MLSIGQVAKRTGIRASAIRYYEEVGILPSPVRSGNRRQYSEDVIRKLDVLRFAQLAGFTLDEIKTLFRGFGTDTPLSARWQKLAREKLRELEAQAQRLVQMRSALRRSLECGCVRIEDCSLSPRDLAGQNGGCGGASCS